MASSRRSIWLAIGAGILSVGGLWLAVGRGTSIGADGPATIESARGPEVLSISRGAVDTPARRPLSVTVRGTVAAPATCLVAGVHVSILPEGAGEALVRVTCDGEGGFVASGVPSLPGLRVEVRGPALVPRTVSLDDYLIPMTDDGWELSAIAMTVRAPLPLVIRVDAWAIQQLAAHGVTAVRAAVRIPPPAARFREEDRIEWLEIPLAGPGLDRSLTLDSVEPLTISWSIAVGHPRVLHLIETSVSRFEPNVAAFEPAVLTLARDRLIVGATVDTEGSQLAGCDVTVVAPQWRTEVRSDASGRFVVVLPADIFAGSIAARYGSRFHAAPVALVPGQPATLRVDTRKAVSLSVRAPDGSVPRWCGASGSNRFRRPLDPTDGLVETVDGKLVLKAETVTPGTWLYVYGPGFEGTVRLTEGLTITTSPLVIRVIDELTSDLQVKTTALAEQMWVRLVEVDDGREPGRIRRHYSSAGAPGQVYWNFDRIAAGAYDGELREIGSGALLGRFRAEVFGGTHTVVVGRAP